MDQSRLTVRSILSCTFCRQKKLRCDRLRPCNSCVKRGLNCAYANPAPPPRNVPTRSTKQLNQRIRQLEDLVNVLRKNADNPIESNIYSEQQQINIDDAITSPLGRMQVGETGTSYVSGAHWAALQHSIADIRECLDSEYPLTQSPSEQGSALLLGLFPPGGMEDFLEFVPSKPIVDRLVSWFFNSMEPGVLILHAPTFQKEYDNFWVQPQDVSLTWLSILFSMMCVAIHLHQRSEGEATDPIGEPEEMCNNFRLQAAYCLIKDKYTTPSKYTIEALLTYAQTEYFRSPDAQHENWVLLGVIIRLAMRVGLHRDGSRFQGISCFEAEMRRRTWAFLCQLDPLGSFQTGLPCMIHKGMADTQLPRNLLDEDFGESSATLPSPRPDTDSTPVSYLIAKSRISEVFGLITELAMSTQPSSYQSIFQLDSQLNAAYSAAPAHLQFRSVGQSVTDVPHIIMRRYSLEILYQKARCVLHRKHVGEGRSDPRYAESRCICIDAAMKLLQHQATIDTQAQPGGLLCQSRWFVTSLAMHDFILAAMILCLELHYLSQNSDRSGEGNYAKDDLLSALETSRKIWAKYKAHSADSMQAWRSISIMLGKLNVPSETPSAADSHGSLDVTELSGDTSIQSSALGTGSLSNSYDFIPDDQLDFGNPMTPGMGVPGDIMMENPWDFYDTIDWPEWDATVQNPDRMGNRTNISTT